MEGSSGVKVVLPHSAATNNKALCYRRARLGETTRVGALIEETAPRLCLSRENLAPKKY